MNWAATGRQAMVRAISRAQEWCSNTTKTIKASTKDGMACRSARPARHPRLSHLCILHVPLRTSQLTPPMSHRQDDHTRDRTPKAFHRTTQDVTSKKICAQCVTIAWGKELIATVNFHRIVEHERWRPQGDRTENQEAPEARIDCSGGEGRAWRRGVG